MLVYQLRNENVKLLAKKKRGDYVLVEFCVFASFLRNRILKKKVFHRFPLSTHKCFQLRGPCLAIQRALRFIVSDQIGVHGEVICRMRQL